jgi:trk system potassium uptake protein TrkH
MGAFDSLIHTFGTAGTGGFSNRALSVGAYNNIYFDVVITVFMLLFSINFGVYYAAVTRRFAQIRDHTEMRVFAAIVLVSAAIITADTALGGLYSSAPEAARHSFFQVASLISTTGYSTADFNAWPELSKTILLLLMGVGACAGSTGGGLKVSRVIILFKSSFREIKQIIHPRSVNIVRLNGQAVQDKLVTGVMHFFAVYIIVILAGTLIVSLDGFGLETSFSGVLSAV